MDETTPAKKDYAVTDANQECHRKKECDIDNDEWVYLQPIICLNTDHHRSDRGPKWEDAPSAPVCNLQPRTCKDRQHPRKYVQRQWEQWRAEVYRSKYTCASRAEQQRTN